MVEQVNFIVGVWSLNEEELKKNMEYFKVPIDPEPIVLSIVQYKYSFRFSNPPINPEYVSHVDDSVLASSLSLHRHPHICPLCTSRCMYS